MKCSEVRNSQIMIPGRDLHHKTDVSITFDPRMMAKCCHFGVVWSVEEDGSAHLQPDTHIMCVSGCV